MAFDTETLSFGGGVVKVGGVDMGFCPEFSIQIQTEKDIKYSYYKGGSSDICKMPSKVGSKLTSVGITGTFTCESLMGSTIQKLGFLSDSSGDLLSALYGFAISATSVHFESSPLVGEKIIFNCEDAFVESEDSINLISNNSWNNVIFTFTGLLDNFGSNAPKLTLS